MKTREEAARFVEDQMKLPQTQDNLNKDGATHYGYQELRSLFDFLYDCEPQSEEEKIKSF